MVTDKQVRRLLLEANKQKTKTLAAAKAGMDEKTARKYLKSKKLPSQLKQPRTYRTRPDPFANIWSEIKPLLETNAGLQASTLFDYIQQKQPGEFSDGQLRSLQRKIKTWYALEGPGKEVFFPQEHRPGELSSSDFTNMGGLGITIKGEPFDHLIFHFALTYSNWETGDICFSECFESLSEGVQNSFWELGGVTCRHRTDSLSAAVHKECNAEEFTQRYQALLRHYGLIGERTNPGKAHENGDIEKSHDIFKRAVDQALMLRGSRDFESRESYALFIKKIFSQLNAGRRERFEEECKKLKRLPERRLDDFKEEKVKVRVSSTISVGHNVYSVESRLIGEWVRVRLYSEEIEVWFADKKIDRFPRLRGKSNHRIQYRHIIDWLIRKPGAFRDYRYREDLFPTTRFRMVYDYLVNKNPGQSSKEYLKILNLAAKESESGVDDALRVLFEFESESGSESEPKLEISADSLLLLLKSHKIQSQSGQMVPLCEKVIVSPVNLESYDRLLPDRNSWNNGTKPKYEYEYECKYEYKRGEA